MRRLLIDLTLWTVAGVLAVLGSYLLRGLTPFLTASAGTYLLLSTAVFAGVAALMRLHRQRWEYTGLRDLLRLSQAVLLGTVLGVLLVLLWQPQLVPRSIPLLSGLIALVLLGGARVFTRLLRERSQARRATGRKRVLIVGAGEAGSLIAREMQRHPEAGLFPVGFLDDDPTKRGQTVLGLKVYGPTELLPEVAREARVAEVLIAAPSQDGDFMRRVTRSAAEAGLSCRTIPGVFELLSGKVSLGQIREVKVEDLLRRPPARLDVASIAEYIEGKVVLVTGAGGSIGSEIVRQLVAFSPGRIVLLGRGESSVFAISQWLAREHPGVQHVALIGDVRDRDRLAAVFRDQRPGVVFHAAAHKHVPLMEAAPSEAVLNNVVGTGNVVELCLEHGVRRLVNVSTDKAVNPTSVMGASKRVAEMLVSAGAARAASGQAFVSVRFGNVLGSRGSVVPTFLAQIRRGGPVTVTHPEMVRYFMTIPEAARLVLQAGGLAQNGRVYVLNMGDPVKIADLARDVIRLSGAGDVPVVYSGMRPGEKLYEELLTAAEGVEATTHSEIFSAQLQGVDRAQLAQGVARLTEAARAGDSERIRADLAEMIPENLFGRSG